MKKDKTEKKVSLLKDCFLSMESFESKADKDEMIVAERNKVSNYGLTAMTGIMFVFALLIDMLEIKFVAHYITIVIGIVNYGMLIAYCRKSIVKHSSAWTSFLWSFITLPLSISNAFLEYFVSGMTYVIICPIFIAAIAVLLYVICNLIYKKNIEEIAE